MPQFIKFKHSFPTRYTKIFFLVAIIYGDLRIQSGVFKNQGEPIAEWYFGGLPSGALVIPAGIISCWFSFLIEPIEIRFVIGNPFFDGLPRRLDANDRFNIKGRRWRARKVDDALPATVESEEEFNFLPAQKESKGFHKPLTARAAERISTPDFEDEIAPEGKHVAGSTSRRGGNEKYLDGLGVIGLGLLFGGVDGGEVGGRCDTSGFIGVNAVVADGLLSSFSQSL